MPINVKINIDQYNLSEHAYSFLSLIYALIIVDFFNKIVPKEFTISCAANIFPDFLSFLWAVFFLVFIIQSWWGARLEKTKLLSFYNFLMFLFHPILLFLTQRLLLNGHSFETPQKNIIFAFLGCAMLFNLIFSRILFDDILNFSSELSFKSKLIHIFKSQFARLGLIFLGLTFIYSTYFFWEELNTNNNLFSIHMVLIIISMITLIVHIKKDHKIFKSETINSFIDHIVTYYLPNTIRNKNSIGFLLIKKKKVPAPLIKYIISQVRNNDVYTTDDNNIIICFLVSDNNIKDFKPRLETILEKTKTKTHRNDIAFNYKEYKSNRFHISYHKYELRRLFDNAYKNFNSR